MRKRKGKLVKGIVPLTHANGVITIEGSEMRIRAWTPGTTMKGIATSIGQRLLYISHLLVLSWTTAEDTCIAPSSHGVPFLV